MAGLDYVSCSECRKRLFYDGEWIVRDYIIDNRTTKTLTCDHCVSKMKKKIEKLKKYDKRRH